MAHPKKLISKAKEHDRKQFTIYVNPELWKAFKKACDKNKALSNRVLEEILKDFLRGVAEGRPPSSDAATGLSDDGEGLPEGDLDLKRR